jgi:hypothetical protein
VPKGVPQDRLDALRAAFTKTMADPAFVAAMKSQGFPGRSRSTAPRWSRSSASCTRTPKPVLDAARKTPKHVELRGGGSRTVGVQTHARAVPAHDA